MLDASKGLALCTCALCGRGCPAWRFFCYWCKQRWGLLKPFGQWPEWARELKRDHQRRRYHERQMLEHVTFFASMEAMERALGREVIAEPEPIAPPELRARADAVLAILTERQQDAVLLRLGCGLSWSETGRALGVTYRAAQGLVRRAMERLVA